MEDYSKIRSIVMNSINRALAIKQFHIDLFLPPMEAEFKRLGFRKVKRRGGGTQKILILRLDAVGDFILTTPAIRAIRENFPHAYITLIVTKAVYPMAELCPYVDEVIIFQSAYKSSVYDKDLLQILSHTTNFSIQHLLNRHFDICFSFLSDLTHCFMAYMSGAKIRISPANQNSKFLMTHPIKINEKKVLHWCERNLNLLMACGLKIHSTDYEIWLSDEDIRNAKNIMGNFAQNRVKVAAGIGANSPERRYPVEKYLVAFKEIISKGASIIIFGGPAESEEAKFLEENLPAEFVKNIVKLNPNWRTTAALISLTDIFIGNDTGTLHVAAAFKKPAISLERESKDRTELLKHLCDHIMFSPSWQTKSIVLLPDRPLDRCRINLNIPCTAGKPHCITQIKPSEIVDAYEKILKHCK